ncbi:alpha/beta hydrolase [Paludibaculum fermentans]|uniref:Alpha/beta fold hydrolase n=1 Tax=Paludibaculum fermentans TaxID=1473598 RepID=A0A7S7NV72_PALFE|nr:alpha/beta fold hydrolase [Paludibaculum fermentans]QOY90425.1 alpha/beta fold hydrolase [Paludibaculum fermentans]
MKRRIRILLIEALVIVLAVSCLGGVVLCENALRLPANHRPSPPAGFGAPVEIQAADGIPLKASWFPPKDPGAPVVILLHGVGDSRRSFGGIVAMFQRNGFGALAPDSRGHGLSGGDQFTFGLKEVGDLNRWCDWVEKSSPGSRLYGLGESMGSGILLQAAGPGTRFRAVVAESPFATFWMVANHRVGQLVGYAATPFVAGAFVYARLRYGLNFREASPLKQVSKPGVPILLIHGTKDENIPIEHTRFLASANPGRIQVWEVPGGDHVDAIARAPVEFEKRVIGFLHAN